MSKTKIFLLQGKSSFSNSKLNQLNIAFNKLNKLDEAISSSEIFLISAYDNLDIDKLKNIIDADDLIKEYSFYVGPRAGTISPWSSKTHDIIKNVGISQVIRIEKFLGFNSESYNNNKNLNLQIFFDRMTQKIYDDKDECINFLKTRSKRPLNFFNILEGGIKTLENANQSFGFALSDQEIQYLFDFYSNEKRNPTDAELMMFAQANSEHCRHKIFNAKWTENGKSKNNSLFDLIKDTSKESPNGIISAYKDNAAIIEGDLVERLHIDDSQNYSFQEDKLNSTIKVETHNHPTAISPYPGASTGSGGEIRDEGATGRGAKPKIGMVGFNVSNLRLPNKKREWEFEEHKPDRIASPLEIMLEAPIGAAAFNNEFGRPSTLGYFRSFETPFINNVSYGYHKPIMLAGGIGEIRDKNNFKLEIKKDYLVVVLGGPAMLIGLGGGAASSVSSGETDEELDFASVQRDNAEMERRCQEVINYCSSQDNSYIEFIHDVGAGGLSNAIPELAKDSNLGVYVDLDKIPNSDQSMSPMEIWSNESQERYVLAIHQVNKNKFEEVCKRERCVYAFVGKTIKEKYVKLFDKENNNYPVNVPLSMLFGDLPLTDINIQNCPSPSINESNANDYSFEDSLIKVLEHPTVASKLFLITIGDRTVSGLVARDQLIGPFQVPVSDYSMTLRSYTSYSGEVLSVGEKPTIATNNPKASMRMALCESLTNMAGVVIKGLDFVQVSANWMAATGENIEDINLRHGVESLSKSCIDLGISVPVGKDSLSMRTNWKESSVDRTVKSPLSGIITAMAPVDDVRKSVTPEIQVEKDTKLLCISLNNSKRLQGSIFSEITNTNYSDSPDVDDLTLFKTLFNTIQNLVEENKILALHDISDGGLIVSLLEMAFTKKVGLDISLNNIQADNLNNFLFAEEIGFVIQVESKLVDKISRSLKNQNIIAEEVALLNSSQNVKISHDNKVIFEESIINLEKKWRDVSYTIQSLRDNKSSADSELNLLDSNYKGLNSRESFKSPNLQIFNTKDKKPKVAILREQGVNGQLEMAAAFTLAGFDAVDVHMQDLLDKKINLKSFNGIAACGGFSYGDVLGAGGGWAKTILNNEIVKDQFEEFFTNKNTFTLGVCNGCQMISKLKEIIPGAINWPSFEKNLSDQFEARLVQVEIQKTNSILLDNMDGWTLPVASAHGEGYARFENDSLKKLNESSQIALNFVNSDGNKTEIYPINPNGSEEGVTGVTSDDGRVTIMMPHPERVFRKIQMSWHPKHWGEFSPWMQLFINAKKIV